MTPHVASGTQTPPPAAPLAKRATTLVSRPPPPPPPGATPPPAAASPDATTKGSLVLTGVVSKGTPTPSSPDDTVPQRNATHPAAPVVVPPASPAASSSPSSPPGASPLPPQALAAAPLQENRASAPLAPAAASPLAASPPLAASSPADDTGRGRRIVTPAPSSTPLDRYSQTHIPIEVRERIRAIVREVVEESMAPLVRWQKDVDARLDRARAGSPPSSGSSGSSSSSAGSHASSYGPPSVSGVRDPVVVVDRESFHDPFMPIESSAPPRPSTLDYLPPAGGRVDVPMELDGGRRKRSVVWIAATLVLLLLTGFLSAMAASQLR